MAAMIGTYYSTSGNAMAGMDPLTLPDSWEAAIVVACQTITGEVLVQNERAGFVLVGRENIRILITEE